MRLHMWSWLRRWRAPWSMLFIVLLAALALPGCQVGPLTIGAATPPTLPHGWSWYRDSAYPFDTPVPPGWQAHGYWYWYTRDKQLCDRVVDLVPPASQPTYIEGNPDGVWNAVRITIPNTCPEWTTADLHGWTHAPTTTVAGTAAQRYTRSDEAGIQQYVVTKIGGRQYVFYFDYSYTSATPQPQASRRLAIFDTILKDFFYHGQ